MAAGIIGLENGQGILIFGENFGNVSARDGSVFPNTFHKDGEPSPEFFAWFPSADVGARAWWRLMLRRYRPVLAAAFDGDPQLAVRELYRLGYVVALRTGEEGDYARGVASLARKAWPVASQIGLTHVDRPAWQGAAALAASVAAAVSAAFLARVAA
ncbi:MAG TPA: hypothetical protein VN896_07890 [Methylomirabilota bacterium]|nr:hypothetical protein [Methylomirabilota bacterium]